MSAQIKIQVKCPNCSKSLMNPKLDLDNLPSIEIQAQVGKNVGRIYLSQVYGSFKKKFDGVKNVKNSIIQISCPHCHTPFPFYQNCECKAPMVGFNMLHGGVIKICCRNGCQNHALEFGNADDVFKLFQIQDKSDWT